MPVAVVAAAMGLMSEPIPTSVPTVAARLATALCDRPDVQADALARPDAVVRRWGLRSADVVAAGTHLDEIVGCACGRTRSRIALFRLALACRSLESEDDDGPR